MRGLACFGAGCLMLVIALAVAASCSLACCERAELCWPGFAVLGWLFAFVLAFSLGYELASQEMPEEESAEDEPPEKTPSSDNRPPRPTGNATWECTVTAGAMAEQPPDAKPLKRTAKTKPRGKKT